MHRLTGVQMCMSMCTYMCTGHCVWEDKSLLTSLHVNKLQICRLAVVHVACVQVSGCTGVRVYKSELTGNKCTNRKCTSSQDAKFQLYGLASLGVQVTSHKLLN